MKHSTRFTSIALVVLMSVMVLGLLAGCDDDNRMRGRRHDHNDLGPGYYDPPPRGYNRGFRQPPPRPIRHRYEDSDDFEDRMDDWKDDYEDWKDDYEDWRKDRREDREDRYDR